MRILWLTIDRSRRALRMFDDLRDAVARLHGVTVDAVVRPVRNPVRTEGLKVQSGEMVLPQLLTADQLNAADFVFCDAFAFWGTEPWQDVRTPRAVLMGDQHGDHVRWYISDALAKGFELFTVYYTALERYWPEIDRFWWLPNCASPKLFHPRYRAVRDPVALMSGSLGGTTYPVRSQIHLRHAGASWYRHIPRCAETEDGGTWPRGEDYARELCSARLAFATCGAPGYTVTKYIEIPACGTALMCNTVAPEASLMGFRPGVNYFPLPPMDSLEDEVVRLLNDDDRLDAVAQAGRELFLERHTTDVRASQFLRHAKDVIALWT